MNIFVGKLAASVTAENLRQAFDGYGTIINTLIVRDAATNLPLGYGHVYLVPDQAAKKAIADLNGAHLHGRQISVRECTYRARHERRNNRTSWQQSERRVTAARRHNNSDLQQQRAG
ncbi:MAG: RNA-binding protein [Gammaproteobacteria bacterium]|nr:RNA-binding protein [Gammaproteobacteria bacterium]